MQNYLKKTFLLTEHERIVLEELNLVLELKLNLAEQPEEAVKAIVTEVLSRNWEPIHFHRHNVAVGTVYRAALKVLGKASPVNVMNPRQALADMAKSWKKDIASDSTT
jgi:hypothetical protein